MIAGKTLEGVKRIFPDNFGIQVVAVSVLIDREIHFGPVLEVVAHIPEELAENDIVNPWLDFYRHIRDRKIESDALHKEIYIRFPLGLCICR